MEADLHAIASLNTSYNHLFDQFLFRRFVPGNLLLMPISNLFCIKRYAVWNTFIQQTSFIEILNLEIFSSTLIAISRSVISVLLGAILPVEERLAQLVTKDSWQSTSLLDGTELLKLC